MPSWTREQLARFPTRRLNAALPFMSKRAQEHVEKIVLERRRRSRQRGRSGGERGSAPKGRSGMGRRTGLGRRGRF